MKKQSNLSRLLQIAGNHKYLTRASWVLSAVSALIALVPYYYIWLVMKEVLETAPAFSRARNLPHNGWMAVLFAVIAVLVYIAGLMCSHLGAFRIATNLRIQAMEHIVKLPLGLAERIGSGKLRKIVNESSAATETYLAHQLPDRAGAIATPCGLLVLLFVFDWRLGLLSLAPVLLGFLIMMTMTGSRMQQKMKEYQNALDDMSNEAVEYVRGIPVVKTFGQTIFSFKKFKGSIDRYKTWVIAYTKELRTPMMLYTAAINGVFAFLIAGGLLLTQKGVTPEFLLNLIFYIIITPIISVALTKIMFQSENAMIVDDIGDKFGQAAGGGGDGAGILGPLRRRKPGVLEHHGVILDDGQRCFQLVGHIGDEIRTQRFDAGELCGHFVEVVDDRIELVHAVQAVEGLDTGGKVPAGQPLCGLQDAPDRVLHRHFAADTVDEGAQKAQEEHICKGDLRRVSERLRPPLLSQ